MKNFLALLTFLAASVCAAQNWPQAAGPNANWKIEGAAPTHWSVVRDENILWRALRCPKPG